MTIVLAAVVSLGFSAGLLDGYLKFRRRRALKRYLRIVEWDKR